VREIVYNISFAAVVGRVARPVRCPPVVSLRRPFADAPGATAEKDCHEQRRRQARTDVFLPFENANRLRATFCVRREAVFTAGEGLFEIGARNNAAWLVTGGVMDGVRHSPLGEEMRIARLGRGQFGRGGAAGWAGSLSPLPCGAARLHGHLLRSPHLRALIIGHAEIGEIVLRAFILGRIGLIDAGPLLVGRPEAPDLVRLQGLLRRNGHPHHLVDAQGDRGRGILSRMGIAAEDLPLLVCPGGEVLKRPSDAEAGVCLGLTPVLDPAALYDVAVGDGAAAVAQIHAALAIK
jgi:thioredoxin reductase (NADPH)